jgi:hypothetical protein
MGAACPAVRLAATVSGDFSRSNARGRSDLHSFDDAWTSQHAWQTPRIRQVRRGMHAATSPFRQIVCLRSDRGRSRCRQDSDGIALGTGQGEGALPRRFSDTAAAPERTDRLNRILY